MSANALVDPPPFKWRRLPNDPAQLYCLLDILPVAAYLCDEDGLITYFNPLAEQIWGLVPQLNNANDRYCGSVKLFASDGTMLRTEDCGMARTLQTGREYSGEEIIIERPDSSRVVVQTHTHPFHDERGTMTGAVAVLVDVTVRKQAESQLTAANEKLTQQVAELQTLQSRKDDFFARLAHELRNPLAPISNALQILAYSKNPDPSLAEIRGIMQRQVQKLVRLLDDVQDTTRITRDTIDLCRNPVRLDAVLNNAVQSMRPAADATSHRLTLSLPPETILLNADAGRLIQVFSSLLTNALQHSAPASEIRVTAQQVDNQVVIAVCDSGIGISPDVLPRIFDMFAPNHGGGRRVQGGLGVGLTISKRIVELHGGQIEARSPGLGHGCEFHITLPLLRQSAEPVKPPASIPPPPAADSAYRILVVDDIKSAAYVLSKLLQALGQQVHTADGANSALEIARRERPDLVISDITMPGVDGYELARWLRQEPELKHSILVALTGHGEEQDREQSKAAGFHHHLVKPVDIEDLRKLIQSLPKKQTA